MLFRSVFVAGLLHDIGKVILDEYLAKEFFEALRHAHRHNLSLHQAEHKILGVTHADVGGWLAAHWNLPSHIAESIAYHHSPAYAGKHRELVAIIHLADVLTRIRKFGNSGNNGKPLIARSAWQILQTKKPSLSQTEIRSYLLEFDREIKKGITLIEILESKM